MKKFYVIFILSLMSCTRASIIDSGKVRFEKPDRVVSVDADTTLSGDFHEVLNCLNIQIINDSILIVQDQVNETNTTHFKAYSTNSFDFMGAFIHNGRGSGEMISPRIVKVASSEENLYLGINSSPQAYCLDLEKTLYTKDVVMVDEHVLPVNAVDWTPLRDSARFTMNYENNEFVFNTIDNHGRITGKFNLLRGIDADRNATFLSLFLISGYNSGKVAIPMFFSPVICFLDTDSGEMNTVAVDKDYRKWQSVINHGLDMNTVQYYTGATASEKYVFAAYRKLPLGRLHEVGNGSSIHAFDWAGNFKYEIKVKENIEQMTFDSMTKHLYCIEKSEGKIIRYDMNGLL